MVDPFNRLFCIALVVLALLLSCQLVAATATKVSLGLSPGAQSSCYCSLTGSSSRLLLSLPTSRSSLLELQDSFFKMLDDNNTKNFLK